MAINIEYQPDALLTGALAGATGRGQFKQKQDLFNEELRRFQIQTALKQSLQAQNESQFQRQQQLAYTTLGSRDRLARDLQGNQLQSQERRDIFQQAQANQRLGFQTEAQMGRDEQQDAFARRMQGMQFDASQVAAENQMERQLEVEQFRGETVQQNQIDAEAREEEKFQRRQRETRVREKAIGAWEKLVQMAGSNEFQNQGQADQAVNRWYDMYGHIMPEGPPGNKQPKVGEIGPPAEVMRMLTNDEGKLHVPWLTPDMVGGSDGDAWQLRIPPEKIMEEISKYNKEQATIKQQKYQTDKAYEHRQVTQDASLAQKAMSSREREFKAVYDKAEDYMNDELSPMSEAQAYGEAKKEIFQELVATKQITSRMHGGRQVFTLSKPGQEIYIEPGLNYTFRDDPKQMVYTAGPDQLGGGQSQKQLTPQQPYARRTPQATAAPAAGNPQQPYGRNRNAPAPVSPTGWQVPKPPPADALQEKIQSNAISLETWKKEPSSRGESIYVLNNIEDVAALPQGAKFRMSASDQITWNYDSKYSIASIKAQIDRDLGRVLKEVAGGLQPTAYPPYTPPEQPYGRGRH